MTDKCVCWRLTEPQLDCPIHREEARDRQDGVARRMLDGSRCWCVSADSPHEGWIHGPNCLSRRSAVAR